MEYVVYKVKETLVQSIISDTFTLLAIGLCVYISQDSTFWTFVTGSMFLIVLWNRAARAMKSSKNVVYSKQELQAWVDNLSEKD